MISEYVNTTPKIVCKQFAYVCGMGRPKLTSDDEPRQKRTVPITFTTVAEKTEMQAHAKRRGLTLAGLIKHLLTEDVRHHGGSPPPPARP